MPIHFSDVFISSPSPIPIPSKIVPINFVASRLSIPLLDKISKIPSIRIFPRYYSGGYIERFEDNSKIILPLHDYLTLFEPCFKKRKQSPALFTRSVTQLTTLSGKQTIKDTVGLAMRPSPLSVSGVFHRKVHAANSYKVRSYAYENIIGSRGPV